MSKVLYLRFSRLELRCFVLCVAMLLFPVCLARTGFMKDQNEDAVAFPPAIFPSFSNKIPTGHLRPLGWQRDPAGKVHVEPTIPTPADFQKRFVASRTPAVFRGVIESAPAMINWQKNKYLIQNYGSIMVDVVVKKERSKRVPEKMKMQKFVKEFNYEDWYLSNYVPHEMMHELVLPSILSCGNDAWLMESELWVSSGGTSSRLHSHADHDLHCVLSGRKDFIFINAKYKSIFNVVSHELFEEAGHSDLNMDMVNMFKNPKIATVPWDWATLRAGDCIFVPAGYLHQVRSYGRSISSTNHFAPTPDVDFSSCDSSSASGRMDPAMSPLKSSSASLRLSDASFLWSYIDGQLMLNKSELDAGTMRHYLLKVMRNSTALTFNVFRHFYDQVMAAATGDFPALGSVWGIIAAEASSLSREEVKSMDDGKLVKVTEIFSLPWRQRMSKSTARHSEL